MVAGLPGPSRMFRVIMVPMTGTDSGIGRGRDPPIGGVDVTLVRRRTNMDAIVPMTRRIEIVEGGQITAIVALWAVVVRTGTCMMNRAPRKSSLTARYMVIRSRSSAELSS